MDSKIGILANNIELKNAIEKLYMDEIKKGNILIEVLDSDKINEQGKYLENKGVKSIIARTGGYRHTIGKVNVPVINMKIYVQDILHSLMIASKYNKDIVLVISDLVTFNTEEWKDLIHDNIIIERFYSVDEIDNVVKKYKDKQNSVVIVGEGIPCAYAKEYNLDYVSFSASDETIHDVIERAIEAMDNLFVQKYRYNILRNVLDHVHDAVVAIDTDENIIMYNERAQELLKKDKVDVISYKLTEIFPELDFLVEPLKNKVSKYNEIINIKNIVVTANITLMELENQFIGLLCTFQDITKLQSIEKNIRFELNKKGLIAKYKFKDIIAHDPIMKNTLAKAVQIGASDSTVMIYGESGSGKEMVAQSIHNISLRNNEPFVAVNCGALTESLLESELFGYEEGSFTGARKGGKAGLFELAHKGTIFLDEINSMSINLQTKLLRVIQEKEVMRIGSDYVIPLDIRILAAANENLKHKIKEGSFRSDLFYRLNILEIHLPPLRKRKMDIIPLFKHFLTTRSNEVQTFEIKEEMEKTLLNYSWPGNVRELSNVAERYILFGELDIDANEVNTEIYKSETIINDDGNDNAELSLNLKEINNYVEAKVISMLENQGMSKNDIAKTLGISRSSLWNKINSNEHLMSKK